MADSALGYLNSRPKKKPKKKDKKQALQVDRLLELKGRERKRTASCHVLEKIGETILEENEESESEETKGGGPTGNESGGVLELEAGPTEPSRFRRVLGITLIFLCSIFATIQSAILKHIKIIPNGEAVMVTAFYATCIFTCLITHSNTSLRDFPNKKFVAMRCVLGGIGFNLKVWSLYNLPLGDATALIYTIPFWAGIIARFYLKEKYTLVNVLATLTGFMGIVLVAKPSFIFSSTSRDTPWWYVLVPVGNAMAMGWAYVCVRRAGPRVDPAVVSFYLAICQCLAGIVYQTAFRVPWVNPECYSQRTLLLVCGVLNVLVYLCLNKGLAIETSGTATLIRNCDTVFAYLVQIFVLNGEIDYLSLIGSGLIISGTVSITLAKAFNINCGVEI